MEECNMQSFSAFSGLLVNQPYAFAFHMNQSILKAFNSICNVMHAFATLFNEFTNRAFGIG
jgi:hypothetical protein